MLKKHIRTIVVAVSLALISVVGLLSASIWSADDSKASTRVTVPANLLGKWEQVNGGIPGVIMTAKITSNKIEITRTMGDTSALYWIGTFDTSKKLAETFTTISKGDTARMANEFYASLDSTKTFDYDRGDLSFRFSMMGITTTVHLQK